MTEEKKGECWKPALKIIKVLQCIQVLIGDPNLEDPLDEDVNEVWKNERAQAEQTAREWTAQYAAPE